MYLDVFNGDADGIFALIQWRMAYPVPASEQTLITGVKRDIKLVQQISDAQAEGSDITILDISFDKNAQEVARVVDKARQVFYSDHHKADKLFEHPNLTARIDTSPKACTGLLVSDYLGYELGSPGHLWAIAAAYGDGLYELADAAAKASELSAEQREGLANLGVYANYNGYGAEVGDLNYHPAELYRLLSQYPDPLAVVADTDSPYYTLADSYTSDLALARQSESLVSNVGQVSEQVVLGVKLANAPWARRISGTYGNLLARENPAKAIVIATDNADGTLTISLRAPKNHPYGASTLCSAYPSGGGREGAAGVNALQPWQLETFMATVAKYYGR